MRDEGIRACVCTLTLYGKFWLCKYFLCFLSCFGENQVFWVTFLPHCATIAMFEIILMMREFFASNKQDSIWAQNCRAKQIATQQITMSSNLKLYIFYDSISPSVDLVALQWMALLSELREFQQSPDWNTVYYDLPSTRQLKWLSQLNSTCSRKCVKGIWNLFALLRKLIVECMYSYCESYSREKQLLNIMCMEERIQVHLSLFIRIFARCFRNNSRRYDMIWYGSGGKTWLWLVHSHTQHCRHFFWFPYFQPFHPRQVYRCFACAQHAMFYDIEKWRKI